MDLPVQLQSDEEVVEVIRRHPASLWGRLVLIALVLIVALFIWANFGGSGAFSSLLDIVLVLVIVGGLLIGFMVWYRYRNDLWVITSQRLIDVTRSTPFNQQITTASLRNVQDISIRRKGIFNTAFNFGDVICQTASAAGNTFALVGVANPEQVLDAIDNARAQVKRSA
ncbi:MAG TPA: PH domain-containing protein [Anaerolineae bacterium]|nr:PH domain-containing protein [Anaerolineae bacterium]HNU03259.1 PH domain-containing protein [Anaerolineae bacterium]